MLQSSRNPSLSATVQASALPQWPSAGLSKGLHACCRSLLESLPFRRPLACLALLPISVQRPFPNTLSKGTHAFQSVISWGDDRVLYSPLRYHTDYFTQNPFIRINGLFIHIFIYPYKIYFHNILGKFGKILKLK